MDSASAALTINPMPSGRNHAGSTSNTPSNAQPGSQPTGGSQPENSSAQADILAAGKKRLDEVAVAEVSPVEVSLEVTGRAKPIAKARRNETFTGDDAAAQLVAALRNAGAL